MTYLLSQLCWWILAAFVIGLATGWFTFSRSAKSWKMGWLTWGLIAFVAGCAVALLKWLPDGPGFWLEAALFLFAAYIVGCFLGSAVRSMLSAGSTVEKPVAVAAPAPATQAASPVYPGARPLSMPAPMQVDNLKYIRGIGPKNEKILNGLGIYRFCQIGDWTADNANWISHYISFPGRIEREQWVEQGKVLCSGLDTEYSRMVKEGQIVIDDKSDNALDDDELKTLRSQLKPVVAVEQTAKVYPGVKPPAIQAPAQVDNLKCIRGIGPKNEKILNDLGIYRFCQIGAWTADNTNWVGHYISFPGRIEREQWVEQGKLLCAGIDTDYSRMVKEGKITIDDKADEILTDDELKTLKSQFKPVAASDAAAAYPGMRPTAIPTPPQADNLKLIRGIGPKNEKVLNGLGVYRFCQIGSWTAANANWVGHYIAFPGRIEREQWVEQARLLCSGVDTEYSRMVKAGSIVVDDNADNPLTDDDLKLLQSGLPKIAGKVENEDQHAGSRPLGFSEPIGGIGDNLKLIRGIGQQNEGLLHGLGIWHFHQIAAWTEEHALWVGSYLAFPGRIQREEWIQQAAVLMRGGTTEFAERVKAGEVETSIDDGSHGQDNIEKVDIKE